ncbi:MAG: sigma-70 family RNA polymerase sigma factor [Verrucomicrobiaceae bacterium]|nr:sigma-70 family RNA polymerase sigma factor [Verrucomicrobiaceae bacterium]
MFTQTDSNSNNHVAELNAAFPATLWSMIKQAQGELPSEALAGWERLARAYWQPLYAFVRRRGSDHHAAADDVQGFFAHLLSKDFLRHIEPGNGLFRSFLLTSLQHWRADQHRAANAQKRGSGQAPLPLDELESVGAAPIAANLTPEEAFDRRWARAVYDNALATLHARLQSRNREQLFLHLRGLLAGHETAKYQEIAPALGMTEGAVKQAALELRREFGAVLRNEIRRTVADDSQVDGEVRYLLGLLRG